MKPLWERRPDEPPPAMKIDLAWQARTRDLITVGHHWRTVLQVRALRDVEINVVRVDFPEAPVNLEAHCLLVRQDPAFGGHKATVEHIEGLKAKVAASQNFRTPLDAWVEGLWNQKVLFPHDYWVWGGRMDALRLIPGQAVGVLVLSNHPARCKAVMGGQ